jgi:hypothetical protein
MLAARVEDVAVSGRGGGGVQVEHAGAHSTRCLYARASKTFTLCKVRYSVEDPDLHQPGSGSLTLGTVTYKSVFRIRGSMHLTKRIHASN